MLLFCFCLVVCTDPSHFYLILDANGSEPGKLFEVLRTGSKISTSLSKIEPMRPIKYIEMTDETAAKAEMRKQIENKVTKGYRVVKVAELGAVPH